MIVRPIIWVALLQTVFINGAAALAPDDYIISSNPLSYGYSQIMELRWMTVLFPAWLLLIAYTTPRLNSLARNIYYRCRFTSRVPNVYLWKKKERIILLLMITVVAILFGVYFSYVPLRKTGLWAIFFDPINAEIAREESLKLVPSTFIRYGINWHRTIFAPILLGLLLLWKRRWFDIRTLFFCVGTLLIILSVMIYGSRSAGGQMLIFFGILFMLRHGLVRGGRVLIFVLITMVFIASTLTIIRKSLPGEISLGLILQHMGGPMFSRMFILPFHTGVLHHYYTEVNGLLMGASIRPLAFLMGIEYIPISNIIGQLYIPGALESVTCNTGSLFDNQASFGLVGGYILTIFELFVIDHFLLAFRRIDGYLLTIFLAIFLLAIGSLVITSLTIALNTIGILWITLFAFLIGQVMKKSK